MNPSRYKVAFAIKFPSTEKIFSTQLLIKYFLYLLPQQHNYFGGAPAAAGLFKQFIAR